MPNRTDKTVFGRTAMDWVDQKAYQPPGMELLGHAGGAGSYHGWAGFDTKQHRGVVALSTAVSVEAIGWTVLQRLPLTQDSFKQFACELEGLGFALDVDKETHNLRVTKVYPKSPASQAGLSAGLIIQKIGGVPTSGKSVAECLTFLRASPKVRLELVDPQRNATNTVEVLKGKFVTASQ